MKSIMYWVWFPVSVVTTLLAGLITMMSAVAIFLVSHLGVRKWDDFIVRIWSHLVLLCTGLKIEVYGLENLTDRGVVYVFNHSSLVDIVLAHGKVPRSFRFGAKAELFKIPIFGRAMEKAGALKIERANLARVIQEYAVAKKRIDNGESFILAPEGTRQTDGNIGAFKTGPFILAINAHAPVAPLVMTGMYRVIPKKGWLINWNWERRVALDILPPVSTEGLEIDDRDELRRRVHEMMVAAHAQRRSALHV